MKGLILFCFCFAVSLDPIGWVLLSRSLHAKSQDDLSPPAGLVPSSSGVPGVQIVIRRDTTLHSLVAIPETPSSVHGKVILFGGASDRKADFLALGHMRPLFEYLVLIKQTPIGFESPFNFAESQHDHATAVKRFGGLDEQIAWMRRMLRVSTAESINMVVTRSTSSAIAMELLHRLYRGDQSLEDIPWINEFIIMVPQSAGGFARSGMNKKRYLSTQDRLDAEVFEKETQIFNSMRWESEDLSQLSPALLRELPNVTFVIGVNDPIVSFAEQMEAVSRFSKNHPRLRVLVRVMDVRSTPASSYLDTGASSMGNLKGLFEWRTKTPLSRSRIHFPPGLTYEFHLSAMKVEGVCAEIIRALKPKPKQSAWRKFLPAFIDHH